MNKILTFLKKIFNWVFISKPVLKMLISFITFITSLVISDNINTSIPFYVGLGFLGYGLLIFIIGLVYAYLINPIKESKNEN